MAKQRGLHQILGKYNDTCYFERKGTRGGLLRRINSGMSERVKTGEDFANLRFANTIFGACSLYASIVLNFFSNRALFVFKKNRQSELTKRLFRLRNTEFVSNDNLNVGFAHRNAHILSNIFDSVVRKKFYDVFSGVQRMFVVGDVYEDVTITLDSRDLEYYCKKYKADGCYIGIVGPCYIYPLFRENVNDKFQVAQYGSDSSRYGWSWRSGDGDLEVIFNSGPTDDTASFCFIYAIPEVDVPNSLPTRILSGSCCGMFSIVI